MPLPIIEATSLAERTTESGPLEVLSFSIFVCVLDSAFGVGAPTAVSVTGGNLVEWGPKKGAAVRKIGSRNHQAASAATSATPRKASRSNPLRQPFTVPDVVHRPAGLERALHQIERVDHHRSVVAQARALPPPRAPARRAARRPAPRGRRPGT